MAVDVLLGLQWGDEGKGKIVDVITPHYDIVARFQGGPNAGHTLEFNGSKYVLHTIPSGIFHEHVTNIIGNGVVIDPIVFEKEVLSLHNAKVPVEQRLLISKKAHLIIPTHRLLDAASEKAKGESKIGSTLKGIGPAYMDKTGRNGLRVGDVSQKGFLQKYHQLVEKHKQMLAHFEFEYDLKPMEEAFFHSIEFLLGFKHIDSEHYLSEAIKQKKMILAEGAQGTLLDIDFGTYPFVTSSNTITAGACTGLGIAPNKIGRVFGIFKAYCTRVGGGPFPTELNNETGEQIRQIGREFGATTGRPRRCGWLDLPAMKFAININGVTDLIMTKADVLSGFDELQVCTHYKTENGLIDYLPYEITPEYVKPVYKSMKGWNSDLQSIQSEEALPGHLMEYIQYLEKELETPITILSLGPDRSQTIIRQALTSIEEVG
jgi:adenylosuccinate synthase